MTATFIAVADHDDDVDITIPNRRCAGRDLEPFPPGRRAMKARHDAAHLLDAAGDLFVKARHADAVITFEGFHLFAVNLVQRISPEN